MQVTINGKGNAGKHNGVPGDLLVLIEEEKHPELLLQHYHRIEALLRGEKVTTPKMKGLAIQYNEEKTIIALSPNIVTLALNISYPGEDIACLSGIGIQEEHITWLCQPIKQGDRIRAMTTEGAHQTGRPHPGYDNRGRMLIRAYKNRSSRQPGKVGKNPLAIGTRTKPTRHPAVSVAEALSK